jgi:integrase
MARKVRDTNLETRTARSRLAAARKPYYRLIEPGLHLGYRKLTSGPGTWVVRRYGGEGSYAVKNLTTHDGKPIVADDYSAADGHSVLSFGQAQEAAKVLRPAQPSGPYTVADAVEDYLKFLGSEGRSPTGLRDARYRARAFIGTLGHERISDLTTPQLRRWRDHLVAAAPRLRTRKGEAQKHRNVQGEDARRARRASVNRTWTILRGALNHAFREGKVESDLAWRKVKPFKNVDAARLRYLTVAEAKRLINASDPEFRPLVHAALLTGARYGELCRLSVVDFNPDVATLAVRQSKSGQARHIVLTDEGRAFFQQLTTGRAGDEIMLRKKNGAAWCEAHQRRPMIDAVTRAKIKPTISFHGLRHTWASHAVMNGVPLIIVARNLGHTDTRMVEKHYGHLAPSYIADAIRKGAPRFGKVKSSNVAPLAREG